ncbi:M23 family metallopeptidase [Profundibacter sp.]
MILRSLIALLAFATPAAASDIALSLPIDCTLGHSCFVQQFVDRDAGPDHSDYSCGRLSYDGHKGTDFALPSLATMQAGVDVLSAAAGVIAAMRDDMPDIMQGADGAPDITGKECGNGIVIKHGDGWETQYCHLKMGSVIVKRGQQVARGDVLGEVGLSGKTQFPHVHLSVRKNGEVIDPYDADQTLTCGDANLHSLWQVDMPYVGAGVISLGFGTSVPKYVDIKAGMTPPETLPTDAPALVLWGYAYGGREGDVLELLIDGPKGEVIRHQSRLEKNQSQFFRAAGKRLKAAAWPEGNYAGSVTVIRKGIKLGHAKTTLLIK